MSRCNIERESTGEHDEPTKIISLFPFVTYVCMRVCVRSSSSSSSSPHFLLAFHAIRARNERVPGVVYSSPRDPPPLLNPIEPWPSSVDDEESTTPGYPETSSSRRYERAGSSFSFFFSFLFFFISCSIRFSPFRRAPPNEVSANDQRFYCCSCNYSNRNRSRGCTATEGRRTRG